MRRRTRRTPRILILTILAGFSLLAAACSEAQEAAFQSNLAQRGASDERASTSDEPPPDSDPACSESDPRRSLAAVDPRPGPTELPAGSHMATIRDRGVLRAGVGVDTLLFGYLDLRTGGIDGFDVEMARLVATAIFGDLDQDGDGTEERLELVPVKSSERIDRLQDGSVDLVVKTMTINCERWASINFSTVYYESGQRLLVGGDSGVRSVEDLDTEPICAVEGTTSLANLNEAGLATVVASTWTGCLVEFQQGTAFGISTDDAILAGLAAQDAGALVVGNTFSDEPYGIGLPKEHPEFTAFVNAVLEQARQDGTWTLLYDRWLEDVLGANATPPQATYRS